MDDVTSGFNIGRNVTLKPEFNGMLGFTEPEVRGLLELYRDHGAFSQDVDAALAVMREWYNGYRFSEDATGDLYNTDMVLHYLAESVPNKPMPDDLIDPNIRIDYTKLRRSLLNEAATSRNSPWTSRNRRRRLSSMPAMRSSTIRSTRISGSPASSGKCLSSSGRRRRRFSRAGCTIPFAS